MRRQLLRGNQYSFTVQGKRYYVVILHVFPKTTLGALIGTFARCMLSEDFATDKFQSELLYYAIADAAPMKHGRWIEANSVTLPPDFRPPPTRCGSYDPFSKQFVCQISRFDDDSSENVSPERIKGLHPTIELANESAVRFYTVVRSLGFREYWTVEDILAGETSPLGLAARLERNIREKFVELSIDTSVD